MTGRSSRCNCDVCKRTVSPTDVDGYCPFCTAQCYPLGEIGGRGVRLAMSAESRKYLHERAEAPETPVAVQIDPQLMARMAAQEVQRRVVNAAVDAAAPVAEQAIKAAFRLVKKRLARR